MPKPTIGQVNWGTTLNDYLDEIAADIASLQSATTIQRLQPTIQQMVSPPTVTQGIANAASVIASSVHVGAANAAYLYLGTRGGIEDDFNLFYSPVYRQIGGPKEQDFYVTGPWAVEFVYDGAELEVWMQGQGPTRRYRLTVVGEGYESRTGNAGPTGDGNNYLIHYDFGSARSRHLRIDFVEGCRFAGIYREASATVSAPTTPPGNSVLVLGDSFTEGSNADTSFTAFGDRLGQYLGTRDVTMSGWGGTGYLADASGTRLTFRERVQEDVIDAAPDLVIVAGGINDHSVATAAAINAEADLLYADIQAGLSGVPIIVVGPFWPNGEPVATVVETRDALRTAAVDAGARLFVDPIGGTIPYTGTIGDYYDTGWLTGTGDEGAPAGDGNADFYTSSDGTHPSQSGHDFLAIQIAEAIAHGAPELVG